MAYKQKKPTFFGSALKQAHWYKINGKPVTKEEYINYQNEPGNMEGGGKTTNDPDASGRKAAIEEARSKNEASKRPTVLTKEQTELLNERTNKKPPLKATRGYNMLMAGAGGKKYKVGKDGKTTSAGVGSGYYVSGDLSYRGDYDTDAFSDAFNKANKKKKGGDDNGGGDKKDNTSSSLDIKWPKPFILGKPTKKQKEYNTTACPNFSKGTNPSDPSGFGAGMGFRKSKKRRGPFWAKEK
jgi:hypothetical protein